MKVPLEDYRRMNKINAIAARTHPAKAEESKAVKAPRRKTTHGKRR
jgi:hypothetical protein